MSTSNRLFGVLAVLFCVIGAAHSELEIKTWFPDNPTAEFLTGKVGTCVIGIRNTAKEAFNISGPVANLALTFNPEMNVYNFSRAAFRADSLGPQEEMNLEYALYFPTNMPAREFLLQMGVYYMKDEAFFFKSFYNETVTVIKPSALVDIELIGLYLVALAILAAVAYAAFDFAKTKGWVKRTRRTKVVKKTEEASTGTEWLHGTAADPRRKKQT